MSESRGLCRKSNEVRKRGHMVIAPRVSQPHYQTALRPTHHSHLMVPVLGDRTPALNGPGALLLRAPEASREAQ